MPILARVQGRFLLLEEYIVSYHLWLVAHRLFSCLAHSHLIEAVCRGVQMVTFDNVAEVAKCAAVSPDIQLILRIVTDDSGSQCRLSSKFGAPRHKWRSLLHAAQQHGLAVVGVSFHVGSGCRDASRYELALQDAKEIFEMAEREFGMTMHLLDIGGGFPGELETVVSSNPVVEDAGPGNDPADDDNDDTRFMTFPEIAEQVAPLLDQLFPPCSDVRIVAEPGRYMVAAAATLCCSVIASRANQVDATFVPKPVTDSATIKNFQKLATDTGTSWRSMSKVDADNVLSSIGEDLTGYAKLYASQQLNEQHIDDAHTDNSPITKEGNNGAESNLEGMALPIVEWAAQEGNEQGDHTAAMLSLAAAGEAAVNGVVLHAVAHSPLHDDYAYYINDGVYGAFNSIMFDHAFVRPRVLRPLEEGGAPDMDRVVKVCMGENGDGSRPRTDLFPSTVFGPTCDSIDVIARSALLPKLQLGDWLYFENTGAYTMAAASAFNGFTPSERFYVCSVQPE